MEKNDLMKEYEIKIDSIVNWEAHPIGYTRYIESELLKARLKAEAYDRLMSGGKKTPKEVANFYGLPIALTPHGDWLVFHDKPWASDYDWFSDCLKFGELPRIIHNLDIGFTGNWEDSLTLPDGWEES